MRADNRTDVANHGFRNSQSLLDQLSQIICFFQTISMADVYGIIFLQEATNMFLHLLNQILYRLLSAAHLCTRNQITGFIQLQNGFDADGASQKRTGFGDPSAAIKMLQVIYGCIQAGVRNCIPNPLCCLLKGRWLFVFPGDV